MAMAESGDTDVSFTAEEVNNVQSLFPSISCDNKLLETVERIQRDIWKHVTNDSKSPYREIAAMSLILLRVQKSKQLGSSETSIMETMFHSLPEDTKAQLSLESLSSCLRGLVVSQALVTEDTPVAEQDNLSTWSGTKRKEDQDEIIKVNEASRRDKESTNTEKQSSATTISSYLEILIHVFEEPIPPLLDLENGRSFENALLKHFHITDGNKDQEPFANSYELFARMFQMDTLFILQEIWAELAGLPRSGERSSNVLARLEEAQRTKANIRSWNSLYTLEVYKKSFMRELDQCSTTQEELEKINKQIELLGTNNAGSALHATSVGTTVATHLAALCPYIAEQYELGNGGERPRQRQTILVIELVRTFGKGVLGILALDACEALAQVVDPEALRKLALFTKAVTKVQLLFDFMDVWLVEPILSFWQVEEHGCICLDKLLETNDWSCLKESSESDE